MRGPPLRADRIRRYVVAWCPRCHEEDPAMPLARARRLTGYLAEEDGRVWLVRGCPDHGRIATLYEEDPEILDYLERWTAPTRRHTPDTPGNFDSVPAAYARGLGEMQTQHTCILLEDVTQRCNLRCPVCYASSSPERTETATAETVLASLDRRIARENGYLGVLMLSGGEPTQHPEIQRILAGAIERKVTRVLLNTNGVEVARDDRLLEFLERYSDRIEVYLQFDGFRESTHRALRGGDLRETKRRALERLTTAGVFTTLVMSAQRGVNEDEIGDVVRLALETPYVGGACIQPVFASGRMPNGRADRLTGTGVLRMLGPQTGDIVTWRDLIALPCSHPHCSSIGYMILTDAGEWRSLVSLIGHERLMSNLDLVSNRIVDPDIARDLKLLARASLRGLLTEQASPARPRFHHMLAAVARNCDIGLRGVAIAGGGRRARDVIARRVKRITVKPFMDASTMIEERLLQCCVHVGTLGDAGEHQAIPFCAAQAWGALAATKLPTASLRA